MKIDLDVIEKMVEAGASGAVVLAYLRARETKMAPKRKSDRVRKSSGKSRKTTETDGNELETTSLQPEISGPRARLFALAPRLVGLGLQDDAKARQMLGQWAKVTHDNVEAIERAVVQAEQKRPADAIGYIRACLQERNKINGAGNSVMDAFDDLIARAGGDEVDSDPPMRDVTPSRA